MFKYFFIYKPYGITSNGVIRYFKYKFIIKKIGYIGTLDKYASGLLLCGIDKNLYLSDYLNKFNKRYIFFCMYGFLFNSIDLDSKFLFYKKHCYFKLRDIFKLFIFLKKNYYQFLSKYSYIKYKNIAYYRYTRLDISIFIKLNKLFIYKIKLLKKQGKILFFDIICSSGVYIRSLINELSFYINQPIVVLRIIRVFVAYGCIINAYNFFY